MLAKALDAKVIVASIAPGLRGYGHGMGVVDPVDTPERHEAEVKEAAARLEELGVTSVETSTGIGDPAGAILKLAEDRGADLIVVGAHDGGALSRFFEGSPGDTIVHKAHTDVLVVH
jgi:nucleotide-binding universal stress UspA family protein